MSKLTKDCRVFVIADNHAMRKGTLKGIYEGVNTAVVDFDDNNEVFEKVKLDSIGILEEETETTTEKDTPSAPIEKPEITITPDEFRDKCVEVVVEVAKNGNPIIGMALTAGFAELARALFFEDPEND